METTICIEDYLSESEIKEVCRDAVRYQVSEKLRTEDDIQRFLTNSSYRFVWESVDQQCPDDMMEIISSKIPAIVQDLQAWHVFRKKDAWDREESKGWTLLQKALTDAEPLIKERVAELIAAIDLYAIRDILNEQIDAAIENLAERKTEQ